MQSQKKPVQVAGFFMGGIWVFPLVECFSGIEKTQKMLPSFVVAIAAGLYSTLVPTPTETV